MKPSQIILSLALAIPAAWLLLHGARQGEAVPADVVRVQYWEKWTGEEKEQMEQIVHSFNETIGKQKHIHVDYTSMTAIQQKMLVSTAAGVPPDVAGLWGEQVVQLASLDAIQPLEELARQHGIEPSYYKKPYWDMCNYKGHLWALISTPADMTLHYSKRVFWENADKLRSMGLDPSRAPRTIDELDRYAAALTVRDAANPKRILRAGYLPAEPGWFIQHTPFWFGGAIFDDKADQFRMTQPGSVRAYEWVQHYSKELGTDGIAEFRGGLGAFNSTANPFLTGQVVMVQQGPWMANYIHNLKPSMSEALVPKVLETALPRVLRDYNYDWGVAAFPTALPGVDDMTFCNADVLVVPRGAPHPAEAFEFIAYVNQQPVMEKLCSLHCKNSPLASVSEGFVRRHLNPYIGTFERLANGPNAKVLPQIPIYPEVEADVVATVQDISLMRTSAAEALAGSQRRMEEKYARFKQVQRKRELPN